MSQALNGRKKTQLPEFVWVSPAQLPTPFDKRLVCKSSEDGSCPCAKEQGEFWNVFIKTAETQAYGVREEH